MKTPFWFRRFNLIALVLLPLSLAYYIVSKIIFIFRLFCRNASKTPVICVGGILAGGVGKTPVVREIAKYLNAPVVMRGYRGKRRIGSEVKTADSAREVGDEAKMLAGSGLSVYVGNRGESIEAINYKESRSPAIVLDDGFQNPRIKKDISVIVFDESVGIGNGLLLPAGPMRETLRSGIKRCDAVLINGSDFGSWGARVMKLAKKYKKAVFFIKKELDATGFFGKYVAFAGIGYPDKFFESLRSVVAMRVVEKISFPDHHFYTKDDILKLFRLARKYDARLVCTEKDWVKLPRNIQSKVKFVPLKTNIQSNFYLWLEKKLGDKTGK
jgi:tetraacyldisaccharide 4'-kinase